MVVTDGFATDWKWIPDPVAMTVTTPRAGVATDAADVITAAKALDLTQLTAAFAGAELQTDEQGWVIWHDELSNVSELVNGDKLTVGSTNYRITRVQRVQWDHQWVVTASKERS